MYNISGDIDKNYQPQICLYHFMKSMKYIMCTTSVFKEISMQYTIVFSKRSCRVIDMKPLYSWSDPTNNEEKRKRRNNWATHSAAETGEQREQISAGPKIKQGRLLVQLHSHTPLNEVWPHETTAEVPEPVEITKEFFRILCNGYMK